MSKGDKTAWLAKVKAGLPGSYKRHNDILRDRRLTDPERIELLGAWPSKDDFERALVAASMQEIRERENAGT